MLAAWMVHLLCLAAKATGLQDHATNSDKLMCIVPHEQVVDFVVLVRYIQHCLQVLVVAHVLVHHLARARLLLLQVAN